MRVAVISDIHANRHALEAVLDAVDAESPDALWCLGDTVGYGPAPNECCDLVRDRAEPVLVGNHDLVVLGELTVSDFNDEAAAAALWTSDVLTTESREFLSPLKPRGEVDGVDLYHASARDPVWEYILTEEAAKATLDATQAPVVLVGHSHVALAFTPAQALEEALAPAGREVDLSSARWLLNPGSVGQPRDGDPRAAYLVLDFDAQRATFRRVPYALERTQEEIRERRLPETLAARLAVGV